MKTTINDNKEIIKPVYLSTIITLFILSICLYIIDDKSNAQFSKLTIYISSINSIIAVTYPIFHYSTKNKKSE